jgi:ribose 5-phosphate isomerase
VPHQLRVADRLLRRAADEVWLALRMQDGAPRITDEGHRILDVLVPQGEDIADVVTPIRDYAGVVETGFFPTEPTEAIIAAAEGIRRMFRP